MGAFADLLYQIASLDRENAEDVQKACDSCQALASLLSAGEQDYCREDMPCFASEAAQNGESADADAGVSTSKANSGTFISCGSSVRVVKQDRSRRATISF